MDQNERICRPEKEQKKMQVTSIFSVVSRCFSPQGCKNQGLFGKGLTHLRRLKRRDLENTVGKVENAGNQYFLLSQCFPLYQREKSSF